MRKMSKRRARLGVPKPTGQLISREELKARSGIAEKVLAYALQTHLLPNAEPILHEGQESAVYGFRSDVVKVAEQVQQAYEATGGDYDQVALRLLIQRVPVSAEWIRRALLCFLIRTSNADLSLDEYRRLARDQRWNVARVKKHVDRCPIRAEDARQFAGTRDLNKAEPAYREMLTGIASMQTSAKGSPLPNTSRAHLADLVSEAPADSFLRVFETARRILIRDARPLAEMLHRAANLAGLRGRSDAQLVELLLPFPGLFAGVRLVDALLPLLMSSFLAEPKLGEVQALERLLGLANRQVKGVSEPEATQPADAPIWTVDSLPDSPHGELPAVLLTPLPEERSTSAQ